MATLNGKVAIITGATLTDDGIGIGGATALLMAREGAQVVVADVLREPAQRLAEKINSEGGKAIACEVDLQNEDSIKAMVETTIRRFGKLDILDNCAAATPKTDTDVVSMDAAIWDLIMEVNVRGTMLACKHAIPHMIKGGSGAIVNISSGAGLAGDLARTTYGVSKAAINTLTQYIATQHGKQGIRCNALCPGPTLTAHFKASTTPQVRDLLVRHSLSPRLGAPEDLAEVAVFLVSDRAAMITGQVIVADGGLTGIHQPFYAEFIASGSAAMG